MSPAQATMAKNIKWPCAVAATFVLTVLLLTYILVQDPQVAVPHFHFQPRPSARSGEISLWTQALKVEWRPCSWWKHLTNPSSGSAGLPSNTSGYLKIECTGGLNQMRRDLCDGVGIARLLNATLLIPHFDAALYWNDTSGFADIFDVDFFINHTKNLVSVVKELPKESTLSEPLFINCQKKKTPFDYIDEVFPALQKNRVVIIRPAASQRSDRYPLFAKVARCEACYYAIRLAHHLEDEAKHIMAKIPRPFLALHLRFEPDMIAYSQCNYPSLSNKSLEAVEAARGDRKVFKGEMELSWRRRGKCLLSPGDVALFLQALRIPTSMPIYLATGDGLLEMEDFTSVYPNIYNKSNLLDEQILKQLGGNSKAAIDYYISVNADYYVATYFGNMEKMVLPMRTLQQRWKSLVLNKKEFTNAMLLGLSESSLKELLWQTHKQDFTRGRGLALPDCFCESIISKG